jgi:2-oxoglutarate ferredoxin oxidoreductase subunit gamma
MAELEIRLSGAGGQGLLLSAGILAEALVLEGRTVAQSQSYEPTSRGGLSRSDLVVGDEPPDYPLATALDLLLILDQCAAEASTALLEPGATVLADARRVPEPPRGDFALHLLPLSDTARRLGNERVANIVALGALVALSAPCQPQSLEQAIRARTPKGYLDLNLEAMREGARLATADDTAVSSGAAR